jgi:hypothetical protein
VARENLGAVEVATVCNSFELIEINDSRVAIVEMFNRSVVATEYRNFSLALSGDVSL